MLAALIIYILYETFPTKIFDIRRKVYSVNDIVAGDWT